MNSKTKKTYKGLMLKISGTSSAFLVIAILVLAIISVRSIETSNHEIALLMGNYKLNGDIASFADKLTQVYGELSLQNDDLFDSRGNSLTHDFQVVDQIAASIGIEATIFIREGQDFRRITTSIINNDGQRVVDTFLGTDHMAYNAVISGDDYIGEAVILGRSFFNSLQALVCCQFP